RGETFWDTSFSADLERSEVLIPESIRRFWVCLAPLLQAVQIGEENLAFNGSVEKMIAQCRGQILPFDLRHLVSEDHACQLFFRFFHDRRIARSSHTFGYFEEMSFLR